MVVCTSSTLPPSALRRSPDGVPQFCTAQPKTGRDHEVFSPCHAPGRHAEVSITAQHIVGKRRPSPSPRFSGYALPLHFIPYLKPRVTILHRPHVLRHVFMRLFVALTIAMKLILRSSAVLHTLPVTTRDHPPVSPFVATRRHAMVIPGHCLLAYVIASTLHNSNAVNPRDASGRIVVLVRVQLAQQAFLHAI